ncbi:MAG: aminodeoxychorismate/anthranilate synthase component II [Bacteroidetes bacterium]|nr:aminodeoxychorismate/anthranilate synthase component II [Bacteroidota bacterium]
MQLLLIDNHDSFTWNLVELLRGVCKCNVNILKTEDVRISEIVRYDRVIFSPGPGIPTEQPVMFRVLYEVERLFDSGEKTIPVFGVCLGMQAIAQHYGGILFNLAEVVHGQPRNLNILQPGHFLFNGVQTGTEVGLYHSWAVERESILPVLDLLAVAEDGTVMALAHKTLPVCGVQFHPESIMTPAGSRMVKNWLCS